MARLYGGATKEELRKIMKLAAKYRAEKYGRREALKKARKEILGGGKSGSKSRRKEIKWTLI